LMMQFDSNPSARGNSPCRHDLSGFTQPTESASATVPGRSLADRLSRSAPRSLSRGCRRPYALRSGGCDRPVSDRRQRWSPGAWIRCRARTGRHGRSAGLRVPCGPVRAVAAPAGGPGAAVPRPSRDLAATVIALDLEPARTGKWTCGRRASDRIASFPAPNRRPIVAVPVAHRSRSAVAVRPSAWRTPA
jgi:hypothetical protein